ncbi:replication-relaxation family protein [Roseovarius indicus]|uniref:replication-relaxation family protein n=1 Tax=Roseovarius indicus TaxID=540747 RepID=UPI00351856F7
MNTATTDSLGRATFHHIAPQTHVRPTGREIRWLKHIERHGPQSSQYLFELTRDTHRCRDTALRQMQKLRAGGYLTLPRQQRATERAEFNPYIYDLTKKAKDHLRDLGLDEPTVRPTGHWWHGLTVSCVTSAIDIAAARDGVRYIPAHEILAIKGADLAIPLGRSKLIPDQLFALDYGGSYRAFALEVDRGTEPKTSRSQRKNYRQNIELYRQLIEGGLYRSHYGLKANMLALFIFSKKGNEERFLEFLRRARSFDQRYFLTQTIPEVLPARKTHQSLLEAYSDPWGGVDRLPFYISSAHQ